MSRAFWFVVGVWALAMIVCGCGGSEYKREDLQWRAFEVNSDGSGLRALPDPEPDSYLSPDGKRVAINFYECRGCDSTLHLADADGSGRVHVDATFPWHFQWSPDSKHLAFEAVTKADRSISTRGVFTVEPNGDNLRQVSELAGGGTVSWSPDGKRIALLEGTGRPRLRVLDYPEGSALTLLEGARPFSSTAWSPDGSSIVFHEISAPSGELSVVSAGGGEPKRIEGACLQTHEPLIFSPDGRLFAFARCYRTSPVLVDLRTLDREVITDGLEWFGLPEWAPDGNKLAVLARASDGNGIYVVDLDSSEFRLVTEISGAFVDLRWVDADTLHFTTDVTVRHT